MLKGSENAASNLKGRSKATFELNVKTVENVIFGDKKTLSIFMLFVGFYDIPVVIYLFI